MSDGTYRVDRRTLAGDWPLLALLLLDVIFALWALPQMPERVPIHWGFSGQPDNWGPGWVNALMPPAIALGMYVLFLFLPLIDPKRRNYAQFPDTLRVVRWALILFFLVLHWTLVLVSLGYPVDVPFIIRLGMPVLFIVLGNLFGRIRHNYFLGVRTPWTLADEGVWTKTHRSTGRVWVAGGLLQIAAAFLPSTAGAVVFFALVLVMVGYPVYLSYRLFKARRAE